ncbi:MAG: endospore germination permease [Syntrophomonadaceae bacterium]
MNQISNLQVFCLLQASLIPTAYLFIPMLTIHSAHNGAWLAFLLSVLPTALLAYLYTYVVRKSSRPFPASLEEHLGKLLGKIIGFSYILVFFFATVFSITYFTALISSSIVPDTPLSIYIGAMLLVSYSALKSGMENIARVIELLFFLSFFPTIILVVISMVQSPDIRALLPVVQTSYLDLGSAILYSVCISGELIAILTFAFFSNDKPNIARFLKWVVIAYAALISLTTAAILMDFGPDYANHISFPIFKLIRTIKISDFIQNIDIIFISIFIMSIFTSVCVKWFLTCFSIQQVFGLRDYRFLAAPTAVMIGVATLMTGKNIVVIQTIVHQILPYLYGVFFVIIPCLLGLVLVFKPVPTDRKVQSPA